MAQIRETTADRLMSIIQLIQLGRRTGTLTARRGEGMALEEGSITFLKGQVTRASVGRYSGAMALNTLTIWENCRFIFVAAEEADSPPVTTTSVPTPIAPPARAGNTEPIPRQIPNLTHTRRVTGPLVANSAARNQNHCFADALHCAPYRTQPLDAALRMIENLGLARTHRRLLLIIDGQRSTGELARLIGKNANDVYGILCDLERAGVIQFPG